MGRQRYIDNTRVGTYVDVCIGATRAHVLERTTSWCSDKLGNQGEGLVNKSIQVVNIGRERMRRDVGYHGRRWAKCEHEAGTARSAAPRAYCRHCCEPRGAARGGEQGFYPLDRRHFRRHLWPPPQHQHHQGTCFQLDTNDHHDAPYESSNSQAPSTDFYETAMVGVGW